MLPWADDSRRAGLANLGPDIISEVVGPVVWMQVDYEAGEVAPLEP